MRSGPKFSLTKMKHIIIFFAALTLKVTLTHPAPLESKFPASFGFNFQNQRQGQPPPIGPGPGPSGPELVPVGLIDDPVPAVKIVENYSVTNVERNQVSLAKARISPQPIVFLVK